LSYLLAMQMVTLWQRATVIVK